LRCRNERSDQLLLALLKVRAALSGATLRDERGCARDAEHEQRKRLRQRDCVERRPHFASCSAAGGAYVLRIG